MTRQQVTIDWNEAAAYVAYKTNEVIVIYPITPSSPMGEFADDWATLEEKNIWGSIACPACSAGASGLPLKSHTRDGQISV